MAGLEKEVCRARGFPYNSMITNSIQSISAVAKAATAVVAIPLQTPLVRALLIALAVSACAAPSSAATIFSENFEKTFPSTNGWTVGVENIATAWYWDTVSDLSPDGPTPHGGGKMAYCAGSKSGTPPSYTNSMGTYMTIPIDLQHYSNVSLSFWYIIPTLGTGDRCSVYVDSFDSAHEVFYRTTAVTAWTNSVPDISKYAGAKHTLIFYFQSDSVSTGQGWFVDDVKVTGTPVILAPTATTLPATAITGTSATLNGVANPNGAPTSANFRWGTTTSYGGGTATDTFYNYEAQPFNKVISGLTPGTTYHYQAVTRNSVGTTYDDDRQFTTPSLPPSLSSITPALVPASTSNQTITLTGLYLRPQATLTFYPPTGSPIQSTVSKLTYVSETQIDYALNNGGDVGSWSVTVTNPDGQTSNSVSFAVRAPITAPNTIGPGTTDVLSQPTVSTTPTVAWSPVTGADHYTLRVSQAPYGPSHLVFKTSISGGRNTFTMPPGFLSLDGDYRWEMTATDTSGTESAPSSARYITVWSANVPTPTLVAPGSAATPATTIDNSAITLLWLPVAGATRYTARINTIPTTTSTSLVYSENVATTSITVPQGTLADGTSYVWTVVAYSNTGLESAAAPPRYFVPTPQSSVVPPPTITLPPIIALNQPAQFTGGVNPTSAEGSVTSWTWSFSDAPSTPVTGQTVTHTFTAGDHGDATLTITYASGKTATTSRAFQVKGNGNPEPQKSGTSLDPVNLATGNFVMDARDLVIPGRGMAFVFERFYNSKAFEPAITSAAPGPLGWGWKHNFEIRISTAEPDGSRVVSFGDGHSEKYAPTTAGFVAEPGVYNVLVGNIDGTFTLRGKNQIEHYFDIDTKNGRLTSIVDRNGNTISVTYHNEENRISSITDTVGRSISFEYDTAGNLSALVDSINRRIEYTVDSSHDLRAVKDPRGYATTFTYDSLHQLLTGTDARSHTFVTNIYNNIDRTVTRQIDASANETLFVYHFEAPAVTTVTRTATPQSEVTKHYHDTKLRLVQVTDGRGYSQFYEYNDTTGDRTAYVDKRANRFTYGFDSNGNITLVTNPDGGVFTLTYTDRNDPLLKTAIDHDQQTTTLWEYDSRGNQIACTSPYDSNNPERYRRNQTVDTFGQVETSTDANGHTTTYYHNPSGNLIKVKDAVGNYTYSEFDGIGRKTSDTDGRGNTTSYALDENGNVTTTTYCDSTTVKQTFDEDNNRIVIEDQVHRITRFGFDEQDRLTTTTDADLNILTVEYDELGNKTSVTEPGQGSGPVTSHFSFDLAGHVVSQTDQLGHSTTFEPDTNGNVVSMTDADGVTVSYEYDPMNRRTRTRSAPGEEITTTYNRFGQITQVEDQRHNFTTFTYNAAGQITTTVDAANSTFTFDYDFEGNRTSVTHDTNKTSCTTYTATNQLESTTDENGYTTHTYYNATGNIERSINGGELIQRTYDNRNRLTEITFPTGPSTSFTYFDDGKVKTMADSLGTTSWTYTSRGLVESVTDPFNQTLSFEFDPNGNRKAVTYPGGNVATYTFDKANRIESVTDWLGHAITREYTDAGRTSAIHYPNGIVTNIGHDNRGRLDDVSHQHGTTTPFIHYGYSFDAAGNITGTEYTHPISPVMLPQANAYTFDSANQISSIDGQSTTHDLKGNLIGGKLSPTSAGNDSLTFDYQNQLTAAAIGGRTTTNRYNGAGHRLEMTRDGITTRFLVDATGALPQIMAETDTLGSASAFYLYLGGSLAARILPDGTTSYYHCDRGGNVVATTDGSGVPTNLYQYDPFGVSIGSSGSSTQPFRCLGGFGVYDNGDGTLYVRARYYHTDLGRFLSRDPLAGSTKNSQSLNRYVYGLNSPIGMMDVNGFRPTNRAYYQDTYNPALDDVAYLDAFSDAYTIGLLEGLERAGFVASIALEAIPAFAPLAPFLGSPSGLRMLSGYRGNTSENNALQGPVVFRAHPEATAEEIAQIEAYVQGSNEALDAGYLSATGRVSTKGTLRTDASLVAAEERATAAAAGNPYVGHAGHVPDTTWTGNPVPYQWLDLSPRVNSSLGGQAGRYPVGYQPTIFIFKQ